MAFFHLFYAFIAFFDPKISLYVQFIFSSRDLLISILKFVSKLNILKKYQK